MTDSEPSKPLLRYANGVTLSRRYRMRQSRLDIGEFKNLWGSFFRGMIQWMKALSGDYDNRVIDAPQPYLNALCGEQMIHPRILQSLKKSTDATDSLGFHGQFYSTGGFDLAKGDDSAHAGIMRRLHGSGQFYFETVTWLVGGHLKQKSNVVSASAQDAAMTRFVTYATSNGRPGVQRPEDSHARYFPDVSLAELVELHLKWPQLQTEALTSVTTIERLAAIVDHGAIKAISRLIDRGVLDPL